MTLNLKKRIEGFTIIEVLIVLAIAGLIMLIVFLAVPALQRSSRNTQRNHDAALVASSVNECLNNHNGVAASCSTTAEILANIDTSKLSQLTTVKAGSGFALNEADVTINSGCSSDGSALSAAPANRSVAVTFQIETGGGTPTPRCISS